MKKKNGFTIVELLVALSILSFSILCVFSFSFTISKNIKQNLVSLNFIEEVRTGLQELEWALRTVKSAGIDEDDSDQVNFQYFLSTGLEKSGTINYDSGAKTISITYDTEAPKVLLSNVDNVSFSYIATSKVIFLNNLTMSFFDNLISKKKEFKINLGIQLQSLL